jgi:glycosyltransferase involved in cell wall biosynthesis
VVADRPTILVLADFYLPGFRAGGPVRSIQNLVVTLCSDFEFRVVTRDRDLGSKEAYPASGKGWQHIGDASVRYLGPRETGFGLRKLLDSTPYDILYLNSFFSSRFSALPLLLRRFHAIPQRPLVIAPRGEFSPGALQLKYYKKRAWLLASWMLDSVRCRVAGIEQTEAENISAAMGERSRIFLAPDITSPPAKGKDATLRTARRKIAGTAKMVFLSRISPKKNLEYIVRTLGKVSADQIDFDIYGPVEDGAYWARCRKLISSIDRPTIQFTYRGEIPHQRVQSVLSSYDLMVLPTLGENFGHVIYDALAAGCPVAISDQTPWAEVAAAGAGWVSP